MSNTIKITKEIPAPEEGWEVQDRPPKKGESYKVFWSDLGKWSDPDTSREDRLSYHACAFAYAYRIPKKKRLMTPVEVADCWLVSPIGTRFRIISFCKDYVYISDPFCEKNTIIDLHIRGWKIAASPHDEPRSLEVDDE